MHRDEGHISENGEKIKNYHAHIEFMGLDSKGNSVRRKLDKKALIELQSDVANILEMQRGKNYTELKEKRPKRLDTYEFKKVKENESKLILASKEQLKEANNQLRTFMKDNGAGRQDYAELEKEKKILEEQLKAKELTQDGLLKKFKEIQDKFLKEKEHLKSIIEIKELDIIELQNQNKALVSQKEIINDRFIDLEEKVNPRANIELEKGIDKELKVVFLEELEKAQLNEKDALVVKNPKTFFEKILGLVETGNDNLKNSVKFLKEEIEFWKNKTTFLVEENKKLTDKIKTLTKNEKKINDLSR